MQLLVRLIVNILIFFLMAAVVSGIYLGGFWSALLAVIILSVVNITLKPLLIILTLPINILTLGLFTFVINALLLLLVAAIVPGFEVSNFAAAFLGALLYSLTHMLLNHVEKRTKRVV
ncbi:phage holin family protein [Candidatus Microgenomates bacterium]|nr:phage holin family protein [Candidatus Microgenomates bacterium]